MKFSSKRVKGERSEQTAEEAVMTTALDWEGVTSRHALTQNYVQLTPALNLLISWSRTKWAYNSSD